MKPLPKPVEDAFVAFMAAFPRRPGGNPSSPAREIFARRVRDEKLDPEALVRAIKAQAAAWRAEGLDPKFIPHARTWLSQRRYEDFLAAAPPPAPAQAAADHPLLWLRDDIGADTWTAWIGGLRVETTDAGTRVIARLGITRDHVRREWGNLIRRRFGEVSFEIEGERP